MTTTHVTRWPIVDDSRTRSELIAEAQPDLPDIVADSGAVLAGEPVWSIELGDTPTLVAVTQVTVIADRPLHPQRATRNANRDRITGILADHPHMTVWELTEATGLSERTVRRHLDVIRKEHAA